MRRLTIIDLTVCIVTDDLPRLVEFYETLLRATPHIDGDYAEFRSGRWTLAVVTNDSIDFAAPGAHSPGSNRSVRLELSVDDVDAEYERLQDVVREWVTVPKTWPWGARAVWLRDPDGNLISLYSFSSDT